MADSTASQSLIGTVIDDRYLITDVIGQGGMGTVYLGRHTHLPQVAAVKVMRREFAQDVDARSRFKREAANAAKIKHPRVARVYDFGETGDGTVYLAMDFVAGRTLSAILESDGALEIPRTIRLIGQIAEGLDAAHQLGIVHRDLKPDNVMVARNEQGLDDAKIVDFGIAKAIEGDDKEQRLTKTGFVVGTPAYMSPEQLLGEEIDRRSDVYTLAIVAYECLTATLPFARDTPGGGMVARLHEPPRPLAAVDPERAWPEPVEAAIRQGLARDRAVRFATAGAFAAALSAALRQAEREQSKSPLLEFMGKRPVAGRIADRQAEAEARLKSGGRETTRSERRARRKREKAVAEAAAEAAAVAASVAPPPPPPAPRSVGYAPPMRHSTGPSALMRLWWRIRATRMSRLLFLGLVVWFVWLCVEAGSVRGGLSRAEREARGLWRTVSRQVLNLLP